MTGFKIKKLKKKKLNATLNNSLEGFKYIPKNNNYAIKELNILNIDISNSLIKNSFTKRYKKVIEMYLKALTDADIQGSDTPLMLALDEVTRLKNIILQKYQKALKKEDALNFLKRLKILENELRLKIIDFRLIKEKEMVNTITEEKSKSR